MKMVRLLLLFLGLFMTVVSCTSEYEERLEQAKELKNRIMIIEASNFITPNDDLSNEIHEMEKRILFLAKVSGNAEAFLSELNY